MNFKNNLKDLREEKEINQEELAKYMSVDRTTISTWETGKHQPDYETLIKLADYFEITTDDLLGRNNINFYKKGKTKNYNTTINIGR